MRVWIINPYDKIPGERWGYKHSLFLAETLASRQYEVTYWTTNFSHATKEIRCSGWGELRLGSSLRVIMVPVTAYRKHIGIGRIKALWDYASGIWKRGKVEARPDFIIYSAPVPFVDNIAVRLSRFHNACLISDLRDLWPDLFAMAFPRMLRWTSVFVLAPFYWSRWYVFSNSHAFTSVCITYLNYAKKISSNVGKIPSSIIYSTGVILDDFERMMTSKEMDNRIHKKNNGETWAMYAGTLGNNYDICVLMEAARLLAVRKEAVRLKFIVAGDGPMREDLVRFIERHQLNNIIYVGTLTMPELCRYYAKSDIGLSIYSKESTVAIPAKAFDYYAAELPIINSVKGEFAKFISENGIGLPYEAGDPHSLANALLEMVFKTPEERCAMKVRLKEIAPLFDRDVQYAQIFDLLDRTNQSVKKGAKE